jgi:voltage-gated potassium channel
VTRRVLSVAFLVTLILVAYFVVPVNDKFHADDLVRLGIAVLSLAVLAAGMIQLLRVHAEDNERRVEGLILGIVVVVIFFALGFYLLARHDPQQVAGLNTRVDALYFAMSTLSTIGFGDVHATGQVARVLVMVQVIFDLVFITAAARLVTAHVRQARTTQRKPK